MGDLEIPLLLQQARELLGARLSHGGVTVRLTEVEAYAGAQDPGSHAFRGRTPRNAVMFGPPGHLYVYFTYGMHHCANIVLSQDGSAAAALLRSGEVVDGQSVARSRRGAVSDRDLARGPARLAQALGLTLADNGLPVVPAGDAEQVVLQRSPDAATAALECGPRVGVRGAGGDGAQYPWRLWLTGDRFVSDYRPAVVRRRPAPGR